MADFELYERCLDFKKRTGRWPRTRIFVDGKRMGKKEMKKHPRKYEELLEEFDLGQEWVRSDEYKLLMENQDKSVEEFPEEYQPMVRMLRGIGHGRKINILEEFESFSKEYGRNPGSVREENPTSEEKIIEKWLYGYWRGCKENKLMENYVGLEIKDIPEEHQDMVKRFRALGIGVVSKRPSTVGDYINFVKANKREPIFFVEPKNDEEKFETELKHKWRMTNIHKVCKKYDGVFLEEIPERNRADVKRIRELWLEIDGNQVGDEVIQYVKDNKREPREIEKNFKQNKGELSEEVKKEKELNEKWKRSFDKKVLDRFVGIPLEEIPENYQEIVKKYRDIGLGYPENLNTRMYIEYIMEHGRRPRQIIFKDGKRLSSKFYSEEELKEVELRRKWDVSEDRKIYKAYIKGELDESKEKLYADMIRVLDTAYLFEQEERKETSFVNKRKSKERKFRPTEDQERLARARSFMEAQNDKNYEQMEEVKLKLIDEKRRKEQEQKNEKEDDLLSRVNDFVSFTETNKRPPRLSIMIDGKTARIEDLPDVVQEEIRIRRRWESSHFDEVLDKYMGIPIDKVPEVYREAVRRCRNIGYGLTFDEYSKFREKVGSSKELSEILRSVKRTKERALHKRKLASYLEEEIDRELAKKGKEHGDE